MIAGISEKKVQRRERTKGKEMESISTPAGVEIVVTHPKRA
jgi:hypothetical protein